MRAKGPLRVLVLLLAASLLPVLAVSAHHDPQAADVVGEAVAQGMQCPPPTSGPQVCTAPQFPSRRAVITPANGPLQSVMTTVNATVNSGYYMFPADETWNVALHNVGCNNANKVGSFITDLGSDTHGYLSFTLGPTVAGECSIVGSLIVPTINVGAPYYQVTSTILASARPTPTPTAKPTPTPTPRPTPTPKLTATPTAKPTATATAKPTATPTGTARPTVRATVTPTPPVGATPASGTASESITGAASASESAVNTPEQSVLGFTFTAEPSSAPPAPAGGGGGNDWAGSVPSANQVSTDGVKLAGSALAALLLLLAMGFIGELFNDTFEGNYDRILAWWQTSWLGRIGRGFGGLWGGGK